MLLIDGTTRLRGKEGYPTPRSVLLADPAHGFLLSDSQGYPG